MPSAGLWMLLYSPSAMKISAVVPAYNEEKNIRAMLGSLIGQRLDGHTLTEVVVVSYSNTRVSAQALAVYPNPVQSITTVSLNSDMEGKGTYTLTNLNGRPVMNGQFNNGPSRGFSFSFDAPLFAPQPQPQPQFANFNQFPQQQFPFHNGFRAF